MNVFKNLGTTLRNFGTTLRNQNSMKKFHENETKNCVWTEFIVILIGHGVAVPAVKVTQ
jgi:hypothetical protein